jgi:SAM-dependent methyltransferase
MVKFTQELAGHFKVEGRVEALVSPAEKLPFPDKSFDLVFGAYILHHTNLGLTGKEIYRILSPGGRAVFIEVLDYNPVVNYLRRTVSKVTTPTEKALKYSDIKVFADRFGHKFKTREFKLFTLPFFYLLSRDIGLSMGSPQFWHLVRKEGERYRKPYALVHCFEQIFLTAIPLFKRYCYCSVITCQKPF